MSDHDDEDPSPGYLDPDVVAARDAVGKAIGDYLRLLRPNENPFVVAWAVGAEWTNAELEQTGRAGRDIISPSEQPISATCGLGAYLVARFE